VLRWFRTDTPIRLLAHDAGIGISTAYRYLHEGIDVLAAHDPTCTKYWSAPAARTGHM
jgi:hypothetical protein